VQREGSEIENTLLLLSGGVNHHIKMSEILEGLDDARVKSDIFSLSFPFPLRQLQWTFPSGCSYNLDQSD
jgi:hypothetical protein